MSSYDDYDDDYYYDDSEEKANDEYEFQILQHNNRHITGWSPWWGCVEQD